MTKDAFGSVDIGDGRAGAGGVGKARIDGESVLVWNDDVKSPAHVRFGYESNPAGINLYNREGLPASPFTTD